MILKSGFPISCGFIKPMNAGYGPQNMSINWGSINNQRQKFSEQYCLLRVGFVHFENKINNTIATKPSVHFNQYNLIRFNTVLFNLFSLILLRCILYLHIILKQFSHSIQSNIKINNTTQRLTSCFLGVKNHIFFRAH